VIEALRILVTEMLKATLTLEAKLRQSSLLYRNFEGFTSEKQHEMLEIKRCCRGEIIFRKI